MRQNSRVIGVIKSIRIKLALVRGVEFGEDFRNKAVGGGINRRIFDIVADAYAHNWRHGLAASRIAGSCRSDEQRDPGPHTALPTPEAAPISVYPWMLTANSTCLARLTV